jgi:hypothetical protein
MANTTACAASSGQLPVTKTTIRTIDVMIALNRWPLGSTCIGRCSCVAATSEMG